MIETTVGRLLVDHALPEGLRDPHRVLDAKGTEELLKRVATEHPERYREVSKALLDIGSESATRLGGFSFGIKDLRTSRSALRLREQLQAEVSNILRDPSLDEAGRHKAIIESGVKHRTAADREVIADSRAENSPLAGQIDSGARGKATNLTELRGFLGILEDHRRRPIPIPVLHNYSEGLTPAEYYAASFGARAGMVDVKLGVQSGGAFAKQLGQAVHRLIVTDRDNEEDPNLLARGLPVETDDLDSVGSLLSYPIGSYKRNTVLTPRILRELQDRGIKKIVVRSPAAAGSNHDGGLYARDLGIRERGGLPPNHDFVGKTSADALAEPVAQGALSSKHSGGVVGASRAVGGFKEFNYMINPPKSGEFWAAHSQESGRVQNIAAGPAGGMIVTVNGKRHPVPPGQEPVVHIGQDLEAGDALSDGMPNPAEAVRHQGIGAGRLAWINQFRNALKRAGLPANRRNLEVVARGVINHVQMNDEVGPYAPNDIVPYDILEADYEPREGHKVSSPAQAVNRYLEKPVLHYTIGTKVTPRVIKTMTELGVGKVTSHPETPPFTPLMVGAQYNLTKDPDWQTRQLGTRLEAGLLESLHRNRVSDPTGTSFVPALAPVVGVGHEGPVQGFDPHETTKP